MTEAFDTVYDGTDKIEWLKLRREAVGGSDAPAVMCLHGYTYKSNVGVFADKIETEEPVDDESERMYWGQVHEPNIVREFGIRTGRRVNHLARKVLLRSKRWPFMQTTLDAEQWPEELHPWMPLEAKNSTSSDIWGDGLPASVDIQVQHQLAVTGKPMGSVAVHLFGCQFKWCDVTRRDDFIENLLVPACRDLMERVKDGGPPPDVDGHPKTAPALAKIFGNPIFEKVILDGSFTDISNELQMLKKAKNANEYRIDELGNKIRLAIGDAAYGALQNGDGYTWKPDSRGIRKLLFKPARDV